MRRHHPLLESAEERATYFALAGERLGFAPEVVEKDFWVCVVLAAMRASQAELRWVFKGGTSLSKAYQVIDRFSEDVDLTLSREGFPPERDPHAEHVGTKERKRRMLDLEAWAHQRLRDQVIPSLRATLGGWISAGGWSLDAAGGEDPEQWLFRYPGAGQDAYMPGHVKLEFGCKGALTPSATRTLRTLVAEGAEDASVEVEAEVPVLALERTFFEKATAVHAFWHRANPEPGREPKALGARLARHWYDLHRMWTSTHRVAIVASLHLLDEVVEHKETWHADRGARYDLARTQIKIVPDAALREPAEQDYRAMASMFPAAPARPTWDQVIATCSDAEQVLRQELARRGSPRLG